MSWNPRFVVRRILPQKRVSENDGNCRLRQGRATSCSLTRKSKLHSAKGKWQKRLQTLFTLPEIEGGHAHRFRDTFAAELLLAGVPLERVTVLLGHNSVRVTERHDAPWEQADTGKSTAVIRQSRYSEWRG